LNAVLEIGISSPSCQPAGPIVADDDKVLDVNRGGVSELKDLQVLLGKALAVNGDSHLQTPVDGIKLLRNASSHSISTMAPGDVPECGETSSLSCVSSMDSDFDDCMGEIAEGSERTQFETQQKVGSGMFCERMSRHACGHKPGRRKGNTGEKEKAKESSGDARPTTMMIRNIPRRYTQEHLLKDLNDLGFTGTFDFLHIPMDKSTSACVGYAFINFMDSAWAAKCIDSFHNYPFNQHQHGSSKMAQVSVARVQGLENNLNQYQSSAGNASKQRGRRLVVKDVMPCGVGA
jgi:hypothetical protein